MSTEYIYQALILSHFIFPSSPKKHRYYYFPYLQIKKQAEKSYVYLEPEFKPRSVSVEPLFLITTLYCLKEKCKQYLFLLQLVSQIVSINQLLLGFKDYVKPEKFQSQNLTIDKGKLNMLPENNVLFSKKRIIKSYFDTVTFCFSIFRNFLSLGFLHYPKVEHSYETFPKPKWHKTKKQLHYFIMENFLAFIDPLKITYQNILNMPNYIVLC